MDAQRLQVLLVSAHEDDLERLQAILADTGVGVDLHVARDGAEGVSFLRQEGPFEGVVAPDLVVLDLSLPDQGAVGVLRAVRDDEGPGRVQVLAVAGDDEEAQLDAVAEYPLHDTARRPLEAGALRRAVAYFGEL
jgi:CheY-like chemotaxis protein